MTDRVSFDILTNAATKMPDHNSLKVGDQIRLLSVPLSDLKQRAQELRDGAEMAGWTADTIERIIASNALVTIDEIDEFGRPWFQVELVANDGTVEHHFLNIIDDESWEYANQKCSRRVIASISTTPRPPGPSRRP